MRITNSESVADLKGIEKREEKCRRVGVSKKEKEKESERRK